jgi:hypothetical protein
VSLESRLQALPGALLDPRLLAGRGLGNELGFYVFDYPPEREPDVQRALPKVAQVIRDAGVEVAVIDLYQTVLELLEGRQFLERAFAFEEAKGSDALRGALKPILSAEKVAAAVAAHAGTARLVLLSNVGAAYPLVRSHSVLNNLHERLDTVPMVMLFPGRYDGQELRLFGLFKDDNYYRAFQLLPEN